MAGIHNISWNDLTLRSNTSVPLTNSEMDDNFLVAKNNIDILYDWIGEVNDDSDELYHKLRYTTPIPASVSPYEYFTGDQFASLKSDFNTLNTSTGVINKLGFTPVQQGGISGVGSNKVIIGWSNASSGTTQGKLLLQVDSTNFQQNWPINATSATSATTANYANTAGSVAFSGVTGLTISDNAQGHRYISQVEPTAVDGADGDIWYQY